MTTVEKPKSKKKMRAVSAGQVHVHATYNNTIVTITDAQGNVLGWGSSGKAGFKGPKKSTPYAATVVVKDLLERLAETGLRDVEVFVNGVGGGRESAVRALASHGLSVMSIKDITPIPHNGPRQPRARRV